MAKGGLASLNLRPASNVDLVWFGLWLWD
jgi:hypothetical protein